MECTLMSLISLQDKELAIEALELYLNTLRSKNNEEDPAKIANTQALLNWIRLEYFKAKRKGG